MSWGKPKRKGLSEGLGLSKEVLDRLAEQMYLQKRLEELRKQNAQQVYYDNKTTPIHESCLVGNCQKCNPISPKLARSHYLSMLLEHGFIDGKEFVERV